MTAAIKGTGDSDLAGLSVEGFTTEQTLQVVRTEYTGSSTTTTVLPRDNTIPQNTEGGEFMTVTITPKSATSTLEIKCLATALHTAQCWIGIALFQDSTADALTGSPVFLSVANGGMQVKLDYRMTSGTTSATTFKIRMGGNLAGTCTLNGAIYNGTMNSFLEVREVL